MKTRLAEGQRTQYSFVKPHVALEGQTPAQASQVSEEKATWGSLLRSALENDE